MRARMLVSIVCVLLYAMCVCVFVCVCRGMRLCSSRGVFSRGLCVRACASVCSLTYVCVWCSRVFASQ